MVCYDNMWKGRVSNTAIGISLIALLLMSWLKNLARKFLYILIVLPLIVTLGCLDHKQDNIYPQPSSSAPTPSTTAENIPSLEIYPNETQVINYIINQKSVHYNDISILNFAKLEKIDSIYTAEKPYFTGGYVAVRLLIKNYTVITMEYKDSDNLFVEANYSAVSEKEKKVFDTLIIHKLNNFYFGSGPLTPTRITFLNDTHAEFKFISDWNDFHKYWIESYGTIDIGNNSIWIKLPPKP